MKAQIRHNIRGAHNDKDFVSNGLQSRKPPISMTNDPWGFKPLRNAAAKWSKPFNILVGSHILRNLFS